jgi:uncharacterized Tic20 family protein
MPGEAPASGYAPPPASGPSYSAPPPPSGGYAPPPSGGYASPPGGSYPPGGGYQPGPATPPPGYASSDDKTWALIAHFGGALGMFIGGGVLGFVAPLIAYAVKGQQSPTVRAHAVAALNFQILWSIIGLVGWIISCVTFGLVAVAAMIVGIIFGIIAGIKANEGQLYQYPMSLSIVK